MKRMRGRGGHRHGSGQFRQGGGVDRPPLNRNHVFESSGPEGRLRGTAQQLFEKYLQLGRDASSAGDRVLAESYFQHAEHYFRILMAINQATAQYQQQVQHRRIATEPPPTEDLTEEVLPEATEEAAVELSDTTATTPGAGNDARETG